MTIWEARKQIKDFIDSGSSDVLICKDDWHEERMSRQNNQIRITKTYPGIPCESETWITENSLFPELTDIGMLLLKMTFNIDNKEE